MDANRSGVRVASDRGPPANAPRPPFRWKSRLGVAVLLFLIIGGLNFVLAVAVPITLHLFGAASLGGQLVLGEGADHCAFLGRCLSDIERSDPAMAAFLVAFMDTMCAFMMSFAPRDWVDVGPAGHSGRRESSLYAWALCDTCDCRDNRGPIRDPAGKRAPGDCLVARLSPREIAFVASLR